MKTLIALLAVGILALTACNSTVTEYGPDGKVVKVTAKESPLTHKTFSAAGSVTALDVETSMSTSGDGSAMPHVLIGGSAASVSSAASDDNKPTLGYSWSAGIVKSLTSSSATSGSITYTGVKNETAAETVQRINAIMKVIPGSPSAEVSVDSGSANAK